MSKKRTILSWIIILAIVVFFIWRFIRPMNIFSVSEAFDTTIATENKPEILNSLSASECANCHQDFYDEWQTSIHSQAWIEPYFQADWKFDGLQQICRNCHTPLDKQQPHIILGFNDKDKWDPILKPNPHFDKALQHEGVTCNACHLREGKIVGVIGIDDAPHPVARISNPNQICVRCHVVENESWDTFFRFPPCGTVAEIQSGLVDGNTNESKTGEQAILDVAALGCVDCHMPAVDRPLVDGGVVRKARQHLWRGGHDPAMVKKALSIEFVEDQRSQKDSRQFTISLENTGAAHYLPTGTPDRHLSVLFTLFDGDGGILKQQTEMLKRTVMWRPFIIDLWDTRLKRYEPVEYTFEFLADDYPQAASVKVVVRYHLLEESRRKRIAYENKEPIAYEVFSKALPLK